MSIEAPSYKAKVGPLEVVGYYSKDGHHTQLCKMSAEAADPYHLGCGRPSKEARAEVQWDNDAQLAVDHASIIVSRLSGQASVYITPDEKGGKAGAGNERHLVSYESPARTAEMPPMNSCKGHTTLPATPSYFKDPLRPSPHRHSHSHPHLRQYVIQPRTFKHDPSKGQTNSFVDTSTRTRNPKKSGLLRNDVDGHLGNSTNGNDPANDNNGGDDEVGVEAQSSTLQLHVGAANGNVDDTDGGRDQHKVIKVRPSPRSEDKIEANGTTVNGVDRGNKDKDDVDEKDKEETTPSAYPEMLVGTDQRVSSLDRAAATEVTGTDAGNGAQGSNVSGAVDATHENKTVSVNHFSTVRYYSKRRLHPGTRVLIYHLAARPPTGPPPPRVRIDAKSLPKVGRLGTTERRVRVTAASGEVKLPRACALLLGHRGWLTFLPPDAANCPVRRQNYLTAYVFRPVTTH